MKQSNWDSYWDKKINEHFNVKPAERIDLREFVESVYNKKYGIEEAFKKIEPKHFISKGSYLEDFLKYVNSNSEPSFDIKSGKKAVLDKKGEDTIDSIKRMQVYRDSEIDGMKWPSPLKFNFVGMDKPIGLSSMSLASIPSTQKPESNIGKGKLIDTSKDPAWGDKMVDAEPDGADWESVISYAFNKKRGNPVANPQKIESTKDFLKRTNNKPKKSEIADRKKAIKAYIFHSSANPYVKQANEMLETIGKFPFKEPFKGTGQESGGASAVWNAAWAYASGDTTQFPTAMDVLDPEGDVQAGAAAGQFEQTLREEDNDQSKPGGSTMTSKTDVMSGEKYRMSFKKAGGSQLMSGGPGETVATLIAVDLQLAAWGSKTTDKTRTSIKKFAGTVVGGFERFQLSPKGTDSSRIGDMQKDPDSEFTSTLKDDPNPVKLAAQDAIHQGLGGGITELMAKTTGFLIDLGNGQFESETVKDLFVKEAMTGIIKFGGENMIPTANHLFVFDPAKGKAKVEAVTPAVVRKTADNTEFNISWKTSGTGGTAWTATKAIYDPIKNLFKEEKSGNKTIAQLMEQRAKTIGSQVINEEFSKLNESRDGFKKAQIQEILSTVSLTEAWTPDWKQAYQYIKGQVSKGTAAVGGAVDAAAKKVAQIWAKAVQKVLSFFKALFEGLIKIVQKGFVYVAAIFGLQLDASMASNPDVAALFLGS
jgi:hypothetical protein